MASELWDLSEPQERVAVALWRSEAMRAGTRNVASGRTLAAFRDQSDETQQKWLEYAAVAIETLIAPRKEQ